MDTAMTLAELNRSAALAARPSRVRWETVLVAAICIVTVPAMVALAAMGAVPLWLAAVVNSAALFAAYTPLHEAVHGNIGGDPRGPGAMDLWIGRIMGALLMLPYGAHRLLHLEHHRHTNDPSRDPDHHTKGHGAVSVALRCLTISMSYIGFAWARRSDPRMARAAVTSVAQLCATALVLIGLGMLTRPAVPLMGFVVPAMIATTLLGFLFDWLVHTPHVARQRFANTRAYRFRAPLLDRLLTVVTLQQNYHAVHHAYPRIPFARYRRFFLHHRAAFEARGAPVWEL